MAGTSGQMIVVTALCCLLFLLCAAVAEPANTCAATESDPAFEGCAVLSPFYILQWRLRGDDVYFKVKVNDTDVGWIGLGVSEGGGMRGTDMAIAMRDPATGNWTLEDYFSKDYVRPVKDIQQDLELVSATETDGVIDITFRRPLQTCDLEEDWPVILQLPQNMVWAYGTEWRYHGPTTRGTETIYISAESQKFATVLAADSSTNPELSYLDLLISNHSVPPAETTYHCQYFRLPRDEKYHIYNYEALVTSRLVHHMILYICDKEPADYSTVFECTRMPAGCNQYYLGWAPGGSKLGSPEEAALPMGNGSVLYAALQVHYSNPTGVVGQDDNSGFRMGYSPKLKRYDMGVLTLGQLALNIPPGLENYTAEPGVCSSECTSRFPGPVTMVNTGFHMHQLGRRAVTQQFRGDRELEPVGERKYFDFNFQHYMPVIKNDTMLEPGDMLVTTCSYDSTSRTNVTRYGERTEDEMCLNFIQYYPLVKGVDLCLNTLVKPYALCAPASLDLYNFTVLAEGLRKGQIVTATSNVTEFTPFERAPLPQC